MKNIYIISLAIPAILLVGWLVYANTNEPVMEKQEIKISRIDESNNIVTETIEAEPDYHLVSLPAMFEKEFVGKDLRVGEVLAKNSAYTRYYIDYQSGDLIISGIMNVPVGEGPWPVLVLNHGYIDPVIYTNGRGLKREQDYFARRGYVVIHPDYRNHANSTKDETVEVNFRLGYIEDVINLVLAVKSSELTYFDKDKIGMLGHSMGGGVTMGVMVVRPDLVQAASLYAPVSAEIRDNFDKWTRVREDVSDEILTKYGLPESGSKFWDDLSPRNFFDRVENPVILHHGTLDKDVPIDWSEKLVEWFDESDIENSYYVYPGGPHEFIKDWPLFMQRNVEFFDEYLK